MLAIVPMPCMSIGIGSSACVFRCIRTPTGRCSRTACCAPKMERGRLTVTGITMLGKSTVLRTGTMISASGGADGVGAGALPASASDTPWSWASTTEGSQFLQRDNEAAVGGRTAHCAVAPRGKPHAALEAALRELKPMDDRRLHFRGEYPCS